MEAGSTLAGGKRPLRERLLLLAVIAAGLVLCLNLALNLPGLGHPQLSGLTYNALLAAAAVSLLARAALVPGNRIAWGLLGLGIVLWLAGEVVSSAADLYAPDAPYPSIADALFLGMYAFAIPAVWMLAGHAARQSAASLGLLMSIVGLATLWYWLVFQVVSSNAAGDTGAIAVTVAYPLLDLVLLLSALLALAADPRGPSRGLVAIAAGLALVAIADSIYSAQIAQGTYREWTLLDSLWPAGAALIGAAPWLRGHVHRARSMIAGDPFVLGLAVVAMAVAVSLLLLDHYQRQDDVSVFLATATLFMAVGQIVVLHRQRRGALEGVLAAERARRTSERSLVASIEAAPDCVITADEHDRVHEWNPAAERTFGYSKAEAVGRTVSELIVPAAERESHRSILRRIVAGEVEGLLGEIREVNAMRSDGSIFPSELTLTVVSQRPLRLTGFMRDVSDRRRREAENERLAAIVRSSDDAMWSTTLDGRVTAWSEGAEKLFGYLSDEAVGRELRQELIPRGREGEIDQIERSIAAGQALSLETVRVRKSGEPVDVALRVFPVRDGSGTVVGISATARDLTDRFLREKREQLERKGRRWRTRVAEALDRDELRFDAQPIVEIATRTLVRHELLLRLPVDGELAMPGEFLPYVEDSLLMARVDRWAVTRAVELGRLGPVAVNLSARSLTDPELADLVEAELSRADIDPERISFEVTETAAAENLEAARRLVEQLRGLGCRVAIDDFGTGWGTFTYLKHLPVTDLKIDMEFIRGLSQSPADQRVVRAIKAVADSFEVRTIAEGVEDARTLELLEAMGIDCAQGYHLGRPTEAVAALGASSESAGWAVEQDHGPAEA